MSFIPWTNNFLTGIERIDEQHKWLVDSANQLHDEIIKPDADQIVVGQILLGLIGATFKHFIMEEELFERHKYPQSEEHLAQHKVFTDHIVTLMQRHKAGEPITIEAMNIIKHLLVQHIVINDMTYKSSLFRSYRSG